MKPIFVLLLQLINAALDISALFEARDDVISRHTRFTSKAKPELVLSNIQACAEQLNFEAERRGPARYIECGS